MPDDVLIRIRVALGWGFDYIMEIPHNQIAYRGKQKLSNNHKLKNGGRRTMSSSSDIKEQTIVSHTSNKIFDANHGKGSLGTAIAAINYKRKNPDALIVGLDTQLAQEWLSDRADGKLPDLIGIRMEEGCQATIDIIEVKTYSDNANAFTIIDGKIAGHAVEQAAILEDLVKEMFGATEKITTVKGDNNTVIQGSEINK